MASEIRSSVPNRLNTGIILVQLAGIAGCVFGAVHLHDRWGLAALCITFGVILNSLYSIVHEAEHGMLFSHRGANDFVGASMALFFPAPFHLIRQGHLGHHLRNRSDDEAFDFYFEGDHKIWKILVWYGILTGLYWVVVVLSNVVFLVQPFRDDKKYWNVDQAATAFMESLNPQYAKLIRLECVAAIVLHVSIVHFCRVPVSHYLAMYGTFGFMWSAMQYVHHYGTERHVTRGARNLWIFAPLDLLWLNHNWHLSHHQHPMVPWVYLPRLENEGDTRRGFLVSAYLRMWRGPRLALERVKNRYAGKLIP